MAASYRLLQSRRARVRIFSPGGSCLPVLPLRVLHQYLHNIIRPGTAPDRSYAAGELSLEHALSCRRSRCAVPAGEVYLSFRSASCAGHFPPGAAMEAAHSRGARLWGRLSSSSVAWLYLLLCALHILERRLCLGRSLCVDLRGTGDTGCGAAAHALSGGSGKNDLALGVGTDRGQPGGSVGIARLLAAAGNLPDGDAGASYVCDCSAFQEHPRLRFGQDGCVGVEHRGHDAGPVGLRSHHDLEFSAVLAAPGRGGAGLGGGYYACHLACRDCGAGSDFAAAEKQVAGDSVRASPKEAFERCCCFRGQKSTDEIDSSRAHPNLCNFAHPCPEQLVTVNTRK